MFRDETVKVEKRVRASWGLNDSSSVGSSSTSYDSQGASARTAKTTSPTASSRRSESASIPTPPASIESTSPKSAKSSRARFESLSPTSTSPYEGVFQQTPLVRKDPYRPITPYQTVGTTPAELGVSFYVQHYLLGYPDEVRSPADLSALPWFSHPSAQSTMAATGLAALANLRGDEQLQQLSRIKYGEALTRTNEVLQDPVKNLETAIRTTVMLALFQVISVFTTPVTRSQFATCEGRLG